MMKLMLVPGSKASNYGCGEADIASVPWHYEPVSDM